MKALTLNELRQMVGQPVWCPKENAYGIITCDKYGKWAGICGELGADLELTDEFMKMGVDELSVAPGMILKLRKRICEFSKN